MPHLNSTVGLVSHRFFRSVKQIVWSTLLLVVPGIVLADVETLLPSGWRVVLTNKSCSECPNPTIKLVDPNNKVLSQLPTQEKHLVFSSAVVQDGQYFVTATTGGEGVIRVYDLAKKKMTSSVQPFGNPKTWGDLYSLGGNEFAIVSGAMYTYLKDKGDKTKVVKYAIKDGKLNETGRFELDTRSVESLKKNNDGKLVTIENKSRVSEYEPDGKLIRAVQFDRHGKIQELRPLKDAFFEAILSVGSSYLAVKVDHDNIHFAPLPLADKLLYEEMKKSGVGKYLGWHSGSFPVRFAGTNSTEIHLLKPIIPKDYSDALQYSVVDKVGDTTEMIYQKANIASEGAVMTAKLGRYSARGFPLVTRILIYSDNGVYEGDMEGNPSGATESEREEYKIKSGYGILRWPNGNQYEGDWLEDKRVGRGRYRWVDNSYFDGHWKEGKREGYGEEVNGAGKVTRGIWFNDKFVKQCKTDAECLEFSNNVKFERKTPAAVQIASGAACTKAVVPNPRPASNESTDYYGECIAGMATTGVVIWKNRGEPVDISCLNQGHYVGHSIIDAFDACKTFLPLIPNYCSVGSYVGQCLDSIPHGVGHMASRGETISIKRGMFNKGVLHGYGVSIAKGGCGPAGCSGNLQTQTGWYDNGVFQTSCGGFSECLENISGKTYSNFLNAPKSASILAEVTRLRSVNNFHSYLEAFQIAGDRADLRAAQNLTGGPVQKSELELILLRIAGLDKIFDLQARIKVGNQSASINEHDKLLGFVRGVDSSLPVKIVWSIGAGNTALTPKNGPYALKVTVGLQIKTSRRTCFLGFCSTGQDVDHYTKTLEISLSPNGKYRANGEFDLAVSGASSGTMFGTTNSKTLEDIIPVMQIESIRVEL